MKINREQFLRKLESVMLRIDVREPIEQSSCFIFKEGKIITFNDEVFRSIESNIDIEGAVAAKPLLAILRKLVEEEIDIRLKDGGGQLLIKGKGRRAGVMLEPVTNQWVGVIEPPEKWINLPANFTDAIEIVQQCTGKDVNNFQLTCVHITNEYLESCDNFQVIRFPVELSLNESCLIRGDSIKDIVGLGMIKISETKSWLHFQNSDGLIFSVRRDISEYPDLGRILDVNGEKTSLPGGLSEAISRAEVFSSENSDNNIVIVKLSPGKLCITGTGVNGWYEEHQRIKWESESISFSISPKLLSNISKKSTDCLIGNKRLKVDNGKYQYVTVLGGV
jgi:DNA polymerase III sliding clamp (beta) subunit (PCNA family)